MRRIVSKEEWAAASSRHAIASDGMPPHAAKNNPISSIFDGIGIGIGFSLALTLLGAVREWLGTGVIFKSDDFGISGITLQGEDYGMLMFVLAPGAFIVLGYLIAIVNNLRKAK